MFGSRKKRISSRTRRNRVRNKPVKFCGWRLWSRALGGVAFALLASPAFAQGPVRISLDDAIRLALLHNHTLLAARTTIDQSKDQEITAYLRPNPSLFGDWEYLPLFSPSNFT